jgi:hypothetical protein
MALNIENLNSYEKNGVLYQGSFPVYTSTAICPVDTDSNFQSDLEADLQTISENDA